MNAYVHLRWGKEQQPQSRPENSPFEKSQRAGSSRKSSLAALSGLWALSDVCAELSVWHGIWRSTRTSEYWGDFLKVDTVGTEAVPCVPVSSGFRGLVVHRQQVRRVSAGDACRLVQTVPGGGLFLRLYTSLCESWLYLYLTSSQKSPDGSFLFITADSSLLGLSWLYSLFNLLSF